MERPGDSVKAETRLHIRQAEFVTSAVRPSQYPDSSLPEAAFAGRSNVGKSSLINVLVNRKNLVKTSRIPGRTRLINFFTVNREWRLVDLPGYGYARVPEKIRRQWGIMIETYLTRRERLKVVGLLLDIRRTPGVEELNFLSWLRQYHLPAVIVATKADKFARSRQKERVRAIAGALETAPERIIPFSAKTRLGRDRLLGEVTRYLSPAGPAPDSVSIISGEDS
ncbi:MAG: YihA family ribosome biogenesis GTP-binding protein [Desulfobacterales bacterium]|nr:MAG: YihA family ribosome biogenesis GTP-binding protein [Desulfobacterales bacterium]